MDNLPDYNQSRGSVFLKNLFQGIAIALIVGIAFFVRTLGNDWDQGGHLHPDERQIIMIADKIHFWNQLNPDFFNYGSLPLYLLKGTAQLSDYFFQTNLAEYNGMLGLGRLISSILDTVVVLMIFFIAKLLFEKSTVIPILAATIYTFAFFPIQNSNFYVTDVLVNFFITLLILIILYQFRVLKTQGKLHLTLTALQGAVMGMLLATKFTGILLLATIGIAIFIQAVLLVNKNYESKNKDYFISLFKVLLGHYFVFGIKFVSTFIFFMPYALLSFSENFKQFSLIENNPYVLNSVGNLLYLYYLNIISLLRIIVTFNVFHPFEFISKLKFFEQISLQLEMNSNPYIFPYTLQYVDTTPYLYYLKNILLWGVGPFVGFLAVLGLGMWLKQSKRNLLLVFVFGSYLFYFVVLGKSAVKFMRYMLPLYPFVSLLAALALYKIYRTSSNLQENKKYFLANMVKVTLVLMGVCIMIWNISFIKLLTITHTRIQADTWIHTNIPKNSVLAIEHWDDRLPLNYSQDYSFEEIPIYDYPDDETKWQKIGEKLQRAEYYIIASNRTYVALEKLNDCEKYKKCYLPTNAFYRDLFAGRTDFSLVKTFEAYPNLQFPLGIPDLVINDQKADESFTVYDHPKIMIFKKTR